MRAPAPLHTSGEPWGQTVTWDLSVLTYETGIGHPRHCSGLFQRQTEYDAASHLSSGLLHTYCVGILHRSPNGTPT